MAFRVLEGLCRISARRAASVLDGPFVCGESGPDARASGASRPGAGRPWGFRWGHAFDAEAPAVFGRAAGSGRGAIVGTTSARTRDRQASCRCDPIAPCRDSVQVFHATPLPSFQPQSPIDTRNLRRRTHQPDEPPPRIALPLYGFPETDIPLPRNILESVEEFVPVGLRAGRRPVIVLESGQRIEIGDVDPVAQ